MKNIFTKSTILSISIILGFFFNLATVLAQSYCNVTSAVPYSSTMPGITNFTLNSINRNSQAVENYPNNSYVNTGLSTNLNLGQSYAVSITHTEDATNFPAGTRNNIRIWIDFNQNGILDDAGETVLSADLKVSGTFVGMILIPATAMAGNTRMRVTLKMSSDAGHTLPTPCDIPADPLGYHGEIEDYTVNLVSSTGIKDPINRIASFNVFPNPLVEETSISYDLTQKSTVTLEVYDISGKKAVVLVNSESQNSGYYQYSFSSFIKRESLNPGIYFVRLTSENNVVTKRIIVTK